MPEPQFALVRRRLLDGGIAPRRAQRLVHELRTHFAGLLAEQQQAGLAGPAAAQAALQRLGSQESLAWQMLARPELRSWSRRGPWVGMGLRLRTLAALLLYRWLPTVVVATAIATVSLRLLRARKHYLQVTEGGTDAIC